MRPYWYPNDADEGRCKPSQVGQPKEPPVVAPSPKKQDLQPVSKPQPKKVKV